jgi:hypothetical protein
MRVELGLGHHSTLACKYRDADVAALSTDDLVDLLAHGRLQGALWRAVRDEMDRRLILQRAARRCNCARQGLGATNA